MKKRSREQSNGEATNPPNDEVSFFKHFLKMDHATFNAKYFEKKHLVCSHGSPDFFTKTSSFPPIQWTTEIMLKLAEEHELFYGTDLNVVRFDKEKGCRVSFRTEGRATRQELEKCMKSGWSIRFLRPHEYVESNSAFISLMEKEFRCYCGLNSYWTPADSQGFAPHYDDVDVFLFQMEGEKVWRLYDPVDEVGVLTRHSSEDFQLEEYPTPKHSFTLKAGDVLYMPRGLVHQGVTNPGKHSLHVTFSANQMHTWADLFERMTRYTIGELAANNVEWRKTLPLELSSVVGGVWNPEFREMNLLPALTSGDAKKRVELLDRIREKTAELSVLLSDEVNIDVTTDEYMKNVVHKLQPPSKTYAHTLGEGDALEPDTPIRFLSQGCCRLLMNVDGEAQLYHCGENSPVCLKNEIGFFRFESVFAPAIATLLSRYPKYTKISSLPFPDSEDEEETKENQMILAENLRDAGLLQKSS
ncbi:hypothetical protein AGDE_07121 [Angomonas deanei]|uniref:Bifunctional lysine-specific demethylase and histidyl-hydroxylase n=1 Tax=Angomonas deanei TaxID=59799 RepID=A0A7G2C7T0_9TRYP|nr:hypothetical protein AGDE_07121 [Angomonas deanei]CAD2214042.1 Cupin superfamily protein/Cupin-like domain containing protein, putative [Angomonas deanei]|eukprot:EPY36024.1 hypothetical protein AGDE_07121 [Angomonas deanei]